ncbi:MAG: hypothetical protein ABII18_10730 [bacterium]|nr:hypothetical protein [bacterium]MBU1918830.1 hypothetical protein [bacterium]
MIQFSSVSLWNNIPLASFLHTAKQTALNCFQQGQQLLQEAQQTHEPYLRFGPFGPMVKKGHDVGLDLGHLVVEHPIIVASIVGYALIAGACVKHGWNIDHNGGKFVRWENYIDNAWFHIDTLLSSDPETREQAIAHFRKFPHITGNAINYILDTFSDKTLKDMSVHGSAMADLIGCFENDAIKHLDDRYRKIATQRITDTNVFIQRFIKTVLEEINTPESKEYLAKIDEPREEKEFTLFGNS